MKRDLDLIKKLLEVLEESADYYPQDISVENYDKKIVTFHLKLLDDAGYIKASFTETGGGEFIHPQVQYITWNGYEFLDLARNNTTWEKSKKVLKEKSISVSVAILTELLKHIARETLGIGLLNSGVV
jgi:hypothetical protein